jgi:hypothetical protein
MLTMLRRRLGQVRRLGIRHALGTIRDRVRKRVVDCGDRLMAQVRPTGLRTWEREPLPKSIVPRLALSADGVCDLWIRHQFDLLGSGPVESTVQKSMMPELPQPWRRRARALQAMLPATYIPIAWHRDPGGYEWSPSTWSKRMTYGQTDGVEVKWPWELARLQHLPPMAGRLGGFIDNGFDEVADEIRAQIVDFIAHNPPGFGVNWLCAMDVGIRAANIAMAVDLARQAGARWDDRFLRLVSATLRDHGRFLVKNLEWGASLSSNHYLGDIAGLLFCGLYLQDAEASDWVAFSGREIITELGRQFHKDGSNFEGSTCYHRLSSEMMVYSIAMMLNTCWRDPKQAARWREGSVPTYRTGPSPAASPGVECSSGHRIPFDSDVYDRVAGMAKFIRSIIRADGSIPIVGDDDSGRFMRLLWGDDSAADLLDHSHLIAAINGLTDNPDEQFRDTDESVWIRSLVGECRLPVSAQRPIERRCDWSDFGLYVWRRDNYQLTLRCGSVGQNGNGGHAHSDQLSMTLDVGGRAVIIDPGTGVYTPDHVMRNVLRGVAAHNCPIWIDHEPMDWLPGRWGLFMMNDRCNSVITSLSDEGGTFSHGGYGTLFRGR